MATAAALRILDIALTVTSLPDFEPRSVAKFPRVRARFDHRAARLEQAQGEAKHMPPLWIGLPVLAAVAAVSWLLVRRGRTRRDTPLDSPPVLASAQAAPIAQAETGSAPVKPAPARIARLLTSAEIFNELDQLAFEVTPLGPAASASYDAIAPRIGAVLEADAAELRHAPRRPLLLPQLLRAIRNDDVSRRELSKIIARDPALAGNLLKLANSSFYRVSDRPVESIDRAVALLGTDGIRSLVATALVQPVFDLSKQAFARFPQVVWEHTYRAATAAEAHAAIVEDTDPFAAQLLGLTMGLGSLVVFRVALEQYARLAMRPDCAVIAALLERHTASVARRIAVSWELSERISKALEDQASALPSEQRTSLGRSLYFGRLIGALAVLRLNERITDEAAKDSMLAAGVSAFQFESIWGRLTGKPAPRAPRPAAVQGSWRDAGRPKA
jgi:HD-like signal output (HDOD) protein